MKTDADLQRDVLAELGWEPSVKASWEEHDDAGTAAWSAPGVSSVENDLVITY